MKFYFENTMKDIIMTKEDEEDFRNFNISEKKIGSDKNNDHCHLTGK